MSFGFGSGKNVSDILNLHALHGVYGLGRAKCGWDFPYSTRCVESKDWAGVNVARISLSSTLLEFRVWVGENMAWISLTSTHCMDLEVKDRAGENVSRICLNSTRCVGFQVWVWDFP